MHADDDSGFLATMHPLGRLGSIDIVEGALYLENAAFVTGDTLHIDRGRSAGLCKPG